MRKVLGEESVHDAPDVGGAEPAALELGVLALLQGGDDRRVGRGPADAVLLEGLDQRGLGVARGGLGEVLLRAHLEELHHLSLLEGGQPALLVVLGAVIATLPVDRHEAGVGDGRPGGAEGVPRPAGEVHPHRVEDRGGHLAGDRAPPDELVEPQLVPAQVRGQLLGRAAHRGRPHRLVRLLGVLAPVGVDPGAVGQLVDAVARGDEPADLLERLPGEGHRVRAHVGDEADPASADVDPLVELLSGAHGPLGGEAELAHRLLLQGGGGEGRRWGAPTLLALHRAHGQAATGGGEEPLLHPLRLGGGADAELAELLALPLGQPRQELAALGPGVGLDRPVLFLLERLDLLLTLHDEAQGRALHPPGGEPAPDLLPQQGREVEAHQVVQRPARLLGVHQRHGEVPRVGHGVLHGLPGDLVEDHAAHVLVLQQPALGEELAQVPGDGLPLAVRVGGEEEGVRLLHRAGDGVHVALVLLDGLVAHLEPAGGVDRALPGHQVAHVPVRGQHLELRSQVLANRARLRGRLDHHQLVPHRAVSLSSSSRHSGAGRAVAA